MKHLKDLTWHPNWDEMAKQLATQAAGAAVAFVRLRAAMPSGPTCACRRCSAWAAMPKRMEMRPGPRYGVRWPLKRPSACSRLSEQDSLILDTATWRQQREAEALLGRSLLRSLRRRNWLPPPREDKEASGRAADCGVGTLVRGAGSTGTRGLYRPGGGLWGVQPESARGV